MEKTEAKEVRDPLKPSSPLFLLGKIGVSPPTPGQRPCLCRGSGAIRHPRACPHSLHPFHPQLPSPLPYRLLTPQLCPIEQHLTWAPNLWTPVTSLWLSGHHSLGFPLRLLPHDPTAKGRSALIRRIWSSKGRLPDFPLKIAMFSHPVFLIPLSWLYYFSQHSSLSPILFELFFPVTIIFLPAVHGAGLVFVLLGTALSLPRRPHEPTEHTVGTC